MKTITAVLAVIGAAVVGAVAVNYVRNRLEEARAVRTQEEADAGTGTGTGDVPDAG